MTCLSWNKENRDIVVVGYSKFNDKIEESGLILCWSCKNPEVNIIILVLICSGLKGYTIQRVR